MEKYLVMEGTRVILIHNMPFDPVNGLHKTRAELEQSGYLVENVPERYDGELPEGYGASLHYDGAKFWWEVTDNRTPEQKTLTDMKDNQKITDEALLGLMDMLNAVQ